MSTPRPKGNGKGATGMCRIFSRSMKELCQLNAEKECEKKGKSSNVRESVHRNANNGQENKAYEVPGKEQFCRSHSNFGHIKVGGSKHHSRPHHKPISSRSANDGVRNRDKLVREHKTTENQNNNHEKVHREKIDKCHNDDLPRNKGEIKTFTEDWSLDLLNDDIVKQQKNENDEGNKYSNEKDLRKKWTQKTVKETVDLKDVELSNGGLGLSSKENPAKVFHKNTAKPLSYSDSQEDTEVPEAKKIVSVCVNRESDVSENTGQNKVQNFPFQSTPKKSDVNYEKGYTCSEGYTLAVNEAMLNDVSNQNFQFVKRNLTFDVESDRKVHANTDLKDDRLKVSVKYSYSSRQLREIEKNIPERVLKSDKEKFSFFINAIDEEVMNAEKELSKLKESPLDFNRDSKYGNYNGYNRDDNHNSHSISTCTFTRSGFRHQEVPPRMRAKYLSEKGITTPEKKNHQKAVRKGFGVPSWLRKDSQGEEIESKEAFQTNEYVKEIPSIFGVVLSQEINKGVTWSNEDWDKEVENDCKGDIPVQREKPVSDVQNEEVAMKIVKQLNDKEYDPGVTPDFTEQKPESEMTLKENKLKVECKSVAQYLPPPPPEEDVSFLDGNIEATGNEKIIYTDVGLKDIDADHSECKNATKEEQVCSDEKDFTGETGPKQVLHEVRVDVNSKTERIYSWLNNRYADDESSLGSWPVQKKLDPIKEKSETDTSEQPKEEVTDEEVGGSNRFDSLSSEFSVKSVDEQKVLKPINEKALCKDEKDMFHGYKKEAIGKSEVRFDKDVKAEGHEYWYSGYESWYPRTAEEYYYYQQWWYYQSLQQAWEMYYQQYGYADSFYYNSDKWPLSGNTNFKNEDEEKYVNCAKESFRESSEHQCKSEESESDNKLKRFVESEKDVGVVHRRSAESDDGADKKSKIKQTGEQNTSYSTSIGRSDENKHTFLNAGKPVSNQIDKPVKGIPRNHNLTGSETKKEFAESSAEPSNVSFQRQRGCACEPGCVQYIVLRTCNCSAGNPPSIEKILPQMPRGNSVDLGYLSCESIGNYLK